jgi:hypothetical protein
MPLSDAVRWARACLFAGVGLMAGTVAHVGAGGLMPSPIAVIVVLAVTAGVGYLLLGTRASAVRVLLVLVGAQTFAHGAFSLLAGHRGEGHGHSAHDGHHAPGAALEAVRHFAEQDPLMVVAHLLATGVLGLWLAWGERAFFVAVMLIATPTLTPWRALTKVAGAILAGLPDAAIRGLRLAPQTRMLPPAEPATTHAVVRRGPPFSLAT